MDPVQVLRGDEYDLGIRIAAAEWVGEHLPGGHPGDFEDLLIPT